MGEVDGGGHVGVVAPTTWPSGVVEGAEEAEGGVEEVVVDGFEVEEWDA